MTHLVKLYKFLKLNIESNVCSGTKHTDIMVLVTAHLSISPNISILQLLGRTAENIGVTVWDAEAILSTLSFSLLYRPAEAHSASHEPSA